MKHSERFISIFLTILIVITLLALITPNIVLSVTEDLSPLQSLSNILLPLGLYWLVMASCHNIGKSVLFLFPIFIIAAFQLVLLNLYGRSVIAVDMFLNVVTTNPGEATELLSNLIVAMSEVLMLYLTPLIMAIIAVCRRFRASKHKLRRQRRFALSATAIGAVCLIAALLATPPMRPLRQLFPLNGFYNAVVAVERYNDAASYPATAQKDNIIATALHPDSVRETYIFVVGETSRGSNWQLGGYDRPTNPRLTERINRGEALYFFPKTLSQSNTTHKSVPLLLSRLTADTFGDSLATTKSIFESFRNAGFETWMISAQQHNGTYIDHFSRQADHNIYLTDSLPSPVEDNLLLPYLEKALSTGGKKRLFVIHTYGSHYCYADRYNSESAQFRPDYPVDAKSTNRTSLINAYDNTIVGTDMLVDSMITLLGREPGIGALLYTSDHGEDIFDDSRKLFLHASPVPTFHQLHVPFLIWLSSDYVDLYTKKASTISNHQDKCVSSSMSAFQTISDLAGVRSQHTDSTLSVASEGYTPRPWRYLNDHNESVNLKEARFDPIDFTRLEQLVK